MAVHAEVDLSFNDKRILNALFDPETLPSSVAKSKNSTTISSDLPLHPAIPSSQLSFLESQQGELINRVSSTSDNATIDGVLLLVEKVLMEWPTYPSAYLNRAMLLRLRSETNGRTIFDTPETTEALFTSLSRAIHVSLPSSSPTPVSAYQAKILRTAYSHRAYLYLKAAELGIELNGKEKSDLEELASADFANAARYGDEVAREMSVRTNPYAKMCGAIVKNALREERKAALG
ncbi:hypothetical protein BDV96DRAFT_643186 [Lophiotrema nucula]|uniref:Uncharacterized protein n=1 Tax=Lophiotrema nucula TaxID=690887 RepID=A0A6A5ZHS3_9PLEO|nr:hypothetical protein BDV96DRAFT_643186 [Lophiotrema nucula]